MFFCFKANPGDEASDPRSKWPTVLYTCFGDIKRHLSLRKRCVECGALPDPEELRLKTGQDDAALPSKERDIYDSFVVTTQMPSHGALRQYSNKFNALGSFRAIQSPTSLASCDSPIATSACLPEVERLHRVVADREQQLEKLIKAKMGLKQELAKVKAGLRFEEETVCYRGVCGPPFNRVELHKAVMNFEVSVRNARRVLMQGLLPEEVLAHFQAQLSVQHGSDPHLSSLLLCLPADVGRTVARHLLHGKVVRCTWRLLWGPEGPEQIAACNDFFPLALLASVGEEINANPDPILINRALYVLRESARRYHESFVLQKYNPGSLNNLAIWLMDLLPPQWHASLDLLEQLKVVVLSAVEVTLISIGIHPWLKFSCDDLLTKVVKFDSGNFVSDHEVEVPRAPPGGVVLCCEYPGSELTIPSAVLPVLGNIRTRDGATLPEHYTLIQQKVVVLVAPGDQSSTSSHDDVAMGCNNDGKVLDGAEEESVGQDCELLISDDGTASVPSTGADRG